MVPKATRGRCTVGIINVALGLLQGLVKEKIQVCIFVLLLLLLYVYV